jgi:hypothetical protein
VTRLGFYTVDLFSIDLANNLTSLNAGGGNCLVEAQHFDLPLALRATAECTAFTARPQNESLVAFRSDNYFLCVRHDVVLQSALTETIRSNRYFQPRPISGKVAVTGIKLWTGS